MNTEGVDESIDLQIQTIPEALGISIQESIESLPGMSPKDIYLTFWHFAKGLCSLGAQNPDNAVLLLQKMREVRETMFS
jgi:hypothetical protein